MNISGKWEAKITVSFDLNEGSKGMRPIQEVERAIEGGEILDLIKSELGDQLEIHEDGSWMSIDVVQTGMEIHRKE